MKNIKEMTDNELMNALWTPMLEDYMFSLIKGELSDRGYTLRSGSWVKEVKTI